MVFLSPEFFVDVLFSFVSEGELPVVLAVITHSAVESFVLLPVYPIVGNKF